MRSPEEILHDVKALAIEYDAATGKPLGVTGEIAEVEAARLLGLHLAEARAPGFDALDPAQTPPRRIQIKGRRIGPAGSWGRMPAIRTAHDFDSVMLVLLAADYSVTESWEAPPRRRRGPARGPRVESPQPAAFDGRCTIPHHRHQDLAAVTRPLVPPGRAAYL